MELWMFLTGKEDKVAAVWQKVRLKPVRALDVILRASALEQARPGEVWVGYEERSLSYDVNV